ncbi:hypothetical protein B808_863 [Fructilactobacillus florum 8D]|uniref:Uncharacterized protein n=1 Tax=Fructilactobacillus florum 8D TaxID=1221538 RepID=W9EG21_9LACO|nr:hypothetical protein B807_1097 [Fructilactobacillus florum 2F]ETO40221.1 hypothetical protein B808_863 [Fructilactobacillus florum 8D]
MLTTGNFHRLYDARRTTVIVKCWLADLGFLVIINTNKKLNAFLNYFI